MKKKMLSVLLTAAMTAALLTGCGGSSEESAASGSAAAESSAADDSSAESTAEEGNKLTVYAWDANFNIPALQAAADDYKANVDDGFELEIIEQSQSSDVENAITLAASANDYSTLPDIVLFQDHWISMM